MLRTIGTSSPVSSSMLAAFTGRRLLSLAGRAARRVAVRGLRGVRRAPSLSAIAAGPSPQGVATPDPRAPRAVFIDAQSPRPLEDSGSARVCALLGLLVDLGLPTAFIADSFRDHDATQLLGLSLVDTAHVTDSRSAMHWLHTNRGTLELVVLSRHTVAAHWLPVIRSLLPDARVVFDTVDLHHVRESREAELRRSSLMRYLATLTRQRELRLVRACDRTWVVSAMERELLGDLLPGAGVDVVSNVVDDRGRDTCFAERQGFVFLGSFRHPPNIDAVEWLAAEIWPGIRLRMPGASLDVIGPHMPVALASRLSTIPGLAVRGFVHDLDEALHGYRVMLAPLRFGAGVKGKINSALACGLPVVATACAVEGMHLQDSGAAIVAEDGESFALRSVELHGDPSLWTQVSVAGRECLALHFSTRAVRACMAESLRHIGVATEAEP